VTEFRPAFEALWTGRCFTSRVQSSVLIQAVLNCVQPIFYGWKAQTPTHAAIFHVVWNA
jgi:hypothetical protein